MWYLQHFEIEELGHLQVLSDVFCVYWITVLWLEFFSLLQKATNQ